MLFGDRSHTWPDEAACSQFAGLEEPFAVVHKAMLHIFLKERNKDAAPRAKPRRSAAHVYQRVQNLVQRIASVNAGERRGRRATEMAVPPWRSSASDGRRPGWR